jgi:hypothetical protein
MENLSLRNQKLETDLSQLLANAQISQSKLLECKKKARALEQKCRHAPEISKKAMQRAETEGNKFSLMEKGVYTEEARELCRVLVQAGCSQQQVGNVVEKVLAIAGISIIGSKMSQRTVARAVEEGGVIADFKWVMKLHKVVTSLLVVMQLHIEMSIMKLGILICLFVTIDAPLILFAALFKLRFGTAHAITTN